MSTGHPNLAIGPETCPILVVDDDDVLRSVVSTVLQDTGYLVTEAASGEEALQVFSQAPFPLVLTDIVMGGLDGLDLLARLKDLAPDTCVVLMTSHASLNTAIIALRAGAYDYLLKPFDDLSLISAVANRAAEQIRSNRLNHQLLQQLHEKNRALEQANRQLQIDILELKRQEEEIQHLANYDHLTALPNRSLLMDRLHQALSHARRTNGLVGLLFLDLDNFKCVNDSLGHKCGDLLLCAVARRLQDCIRTSDTVARLGGDEFVVLLTTNQNAEEVGLVAQKILDLFRDPFNLEGREVFVGTSIGISLFPQDGSHGETLLKQADMAMYEAKKREKSTFQFYSETLNQRAQHRHQIESGLRRALQEGELFLVYQPQIDLRSGQITGVEALLRWRHKETGLIMPDRFIAIAEETGLIQPIGEWVLRTACAQAMHWEQAGLPPLSLAVNLSGYQFRRGRLNETIDQILAETGWQPQNLELELTEGVLMDCAQDSVAALSALKDRGLRLAIDDFGTGYSSLNYLKHFPIDRIKIDRSFIANLNANPDDAAITEAIISMSKSLRLQIIAEGVETYDSMEFLRDRGCFDMQGYLFSRPMEAADLGRLLAEPNLLKRLIPNSKMEQLLQR